MSELRRRPWPGGGEAGGSPPGQPSGSLQPATGNRLNRIFAVAAVLVAVVLGLSVVMGSWYTIDQGERGVVLRNGALRGAAEPGLGFKLPLIDTVTKISVQSHVQTFDKMEAYSLDQQPAETRVSVNYRIPAASATDIYERFGGRVAMVDRAINPVVFQQAKVVFGRFTALRAIQDRGRLNSEIETAIRENVDKLITIESVQVEDIKFSQAYESSIEQRMLAEVEVQRIRQNAEREKVSAEITVTQARAKADAVRQAAQAESEAIKLRGDAEALAIKARGDALRENPGLVALTQAERWDGKLPTTMVPGSAVPMLSLQPGR